MDILYPCSLCTQTFTLRKHILRHMKTAHELNVSSMYCNDDTKSLFNCLQCHKQFHSNGLLNKHKHLKHNISMSNLRNYISRPPAKRVHNKLNDFLILKDFLPENYSYQLLAFKDLLYGQFNAKFRIINIDNESFLGWLNKLCHKTKVNYGTENEPSIDLKNKHRKVYTCKNIDYWNIKSNKILQNPTNCKASISVVFKALNKELAHRSSAVILMKHCHCHPMNYFTSVNLYQAIHNVYNEFILLLGTCQSAADALHAYKIKTIQNEGKCQYMKLMDSGIKPDVEFVYDLYYRRIRKSSFSLPFNKRVESLIKSVKHYNASIGMKSAVIRLIKKNIVVAIQTPLMKTINTNTVFVCSTSFDICKTWFLFSENDSKLIIPVGVIISTSNNDFLLKAGLHLWKKLGGVVKTVVVDFKYRYIFQSVFPEATVCVSKFHFLLSVWRWLMSATDKNKLNKELNCYAELKTIICSEYFIDKHFLDTNFDITLTEKYPSFKQFMQNIDKNNFLFCSLRSTHPCSTISERKLIYHHTKSLSILQMFHFVTNEIDLFYSNLSANSPNNQQIILNNFKEIIDNENHFTYCNMNDNHSMYLVKNDNGGKFLVDMDIGLCSCIINHVCSVCIHQVFLNKHLNKKNINCSADSDTCVLKTSNYDNEKLNIEKKEFENILSEFKSVNNKIKEQFMIDPEYFKAGIQRFVSTWKNNLTSDKSLFLVLHSLNNINQSNIGKDS